MNNHNSPASVWRVNVEVLKRFLVCTAACTCVGVMYIQWTYIWMLRSEMAEIAQRFRALDTAGDEGGICCDSAVCYGVGECFSDCYFNCLTFFIVASPTNALFFAPVNWLCQSIVWRIQCNQYGKDSVLWYISKFSGCYV